MVIKLCEFADEQEYITRSWELWRLYSLQSCMWKFPNQFIKIFLKEITIKVNPSMSSI